MGFYCKNLPYTFKVKETFLNKSSQKGHIDNFAVVPHQYKVPAPRKKVSSAEHALVNKDQKLDLK